MQTHRGKCSECKKQHYSNRKDDIVVCDCWRRCPVCGAEMTQFTPDLTPNVYGVDGLHDMHILMVCSNHSPPFYSTQKPVEVTCS